MCISQTFVSISTSVVIKIALLKLINELINLGNKKDILVLLRCFLRALNYRASAHWYRNQRAHVNMNMSSGHSKLVAIRVYAVDTYAMLSKWLWCDVFGAAYFTI